MRTYTVYCVYIILLTLISGMSFLFGHILNNKSIDTIFINSNQAVYNKNPLEIRSSSSSSSLVNPLLECGDLENISNEKTAKIKLKVEAIIKDSQLENSAEHIAVYFRSFKDGPWFGINEKEQFIPGSLLKVPLMMALFKKDEYNPGFLQERVSFNNDNLPYPQYFKPTKSVQSDTEYSILDLINYMIKYSDNRAAILLAQLINQDELLDDYRDLGIQIPVNNEYQISVKTYASFFRILYNATYLNRENSEKALQILSEADFNKGLTAKLPDNIKVAHKFGERNENIKQLHDCGIIYYPNKPYLLCIMTRGKDFNILSNLISNISEAVYRDIK